MSSLKKYDPNTSLQTVCNWFQWCALDTWERIGFARTRKGLKIWETTLTQNLLINFHRSKQLFGYQDADWLNIEVYEAVDEKTNGNDIELFVQTKDGPMFFAVQAKVIYHNTSTHGNGYYKQMKHLNTKGEQIDLLCDYAKKKKGIPLYLLYNWVNKVFDKKEKCKVHYDISQYGCSIVDALHIRSKYFNAGKWTIPTFLDLHPKPALPWFVIACCFTEMTKKEIKEMLGVAGLDYELRDYSIQDIKNDKDWKTFEPFEYLFDKVPKPKELKPKMKFNPKFRIFISTNKPQ
ncbi:MAG: hypothetical protein ACI9YE_000894 [Psychroserpens sp.]|jgi:hypothetical protein